VSQNIQTALAALGADEAVLSSAEKKSLDERGFAVFEGVLDAGWLQRLRATYEALMAKEGANAGKEVHQEEGTRRLADLVNKGEVFDGIYTHPRILAAVHWILKRDFKLSSLNARDAVPGFGQQTLHADWGPRQAAQPFQVVNSVWMIDNFTPQNGATRVLPGSHLLDGGPADHIKDPNATHPDEVLAVAPAGSVLVFNAHVWHGGTKNCTEKTRRACHGYFTAREHGQQLDQREYLRKSTFDRLSPAARYILDVD
jgi:ectoine hydroxylase-related dioxygenase (phytanoyl-CoA dioxygenase family)